MRQTLVRQGLAASAAAPTDDRRGAPDPCGIPAVAGCACLARPRAALQEGGGGAIMLSQKAKYALRALVELARASGEQLTSGELALRADAPRKFLEAILLELSRNAIVVSRRGKFGGYLLARAPETITFAEVIRVIDGPLALAPCVSPRLGFRKCDDCEDLATCSLREALARARDATAQVLEGYSLADAATLSDGETGLRTAS
jgi:Rrf2 family protein